MYKAAADPSLSLGVSEAARLLEVASQSSDENQDALL